MTPFQALQIFIEDKLYIPLFKLFAGAMAFYFAVYTLCGIIY